jgi:hypothetical protein
VNAHREWSPKTSRIERTRKVDRPSLAVAFDTLRDLARLKSLRAVLEAVGAPDVPVKAHALGPERAVSLWKGMPEEKDWALSPYLVEVDEELLGWIRETLWSGGSWGILLESARPVEDLRQHFRKWVVVEDPNGDAMHFRFYDALVLRELLSAATAEETADFFGPVTKLFGVYDEPGKKEPVIRAFHKPWREATTRVRR